MNKNRLTNTSLGSMLGVSHAHVSRIRQGVRTPSDTLMLKLSRLVDWPLEEQIELKIQQIQSKGKEYADRFREFEAQLAAQADEEIEG